MQAVIMQLQQFQPMKTERESYMLTDGISSDSKSLAAHIL